MILNNIFCFSEQSRIKNIGKEEIMKKVNVINDFKL